MSTKMFCNTSPQLLFKQVFFQIYFKVCQVPGSELVGYCEYFNSYI